MTTQTETYRGPDGVIRRRPVTPPKAEQKAPSPASRPESHPMEIFAGKRIVIQRGPVTYTGTLKVVTRRWLILADATVAGSQRTVNVPECYVNAEPSQIAHVHLEVQP